MNLAPTSAAGLRAPTRCSSGWTAAPAAPAVRVDGRSGNRITAGTQFGSGVAAIQTVGADSPDAAVQQGLRALAQNDWDTLFKLVPPDEIPVYDYRNVLKELIARNEARTRFTIDHMDTTSQVHGDTASVVVHASGTTDSGSWSLDGRCFEGPAESDGTSVYPQFCVDGTGSAVRSVLGVFGSTTNQTP